MGAVGLMRFFSRKGSSVLRNFVYRKLFWESKKSLSGVSIRNLGVGMCGGSCREDSISGRGCGCILVGEFFVGWVELGIRFYR